MHTCFALCLDKPVLVNVELEGKQRAPPLPPAAPARLLRLYLLHMAFDMVPRKVGGKCVGGE